MAELAPSVRRPLWQGHQAVHGLWFSAQWLDTPARVARLLRAWRPGSRALRYEDGDLLLFGDVVQLDCTRCEGQPLCRLQSTLSSAPLEPDERRRLPTADVWLVCGAVVRALDFTDGAALAL